MSFEIPEDHQIRELKTVIVCLKAIRREETKIFQTQIQLQQLLINEQADRIRTLEITNGEYLN